MKRILAALLLLTLAAPAWGQDFEKGYQAYERGDYAAALREWRPLADQGRARAQFNLGAMYHDGRGVPQDFAEAAKWYRKAADQGQARAQALLGNVYAKGKGVPQDFAEAVKWYRKAADHWLCFAKPKTAAARCHRVSGKDGPTEREARNRLIESYNRRAPPEKQIQPEC